MKTWRQAVARWIIPARAGFTPKSSPRRSAHSDHPRSRGVYVIFSAPLVSSIGSSPLARGLHRGERWRVRDVGIIPARAGFTLESPGVGGEFGGSSPLARGLPKRRDGLYAAGRIIPARAGFTQEAGEAEEFPWDHPRSRGVYRLELGERGEITDHPRSRGVYQALNAADATLKGSSPLARGLRRGRPPQ